MHAKWSRPTQLIAFAVALLPLAACGSGNNPTTPVSVAGTPTPAPTPAPTPTPTPDPGPTPEPPVTRTTQPVRLTLRLYVVETPSGSLYDYPFEPDGTPIVWVDYRVRLDIVAKDNRNRETIGTGNVEWVWDDGMIEVINFNNVFQPRVRAARGGRFPVYAVLDGVRSNNLELSFRYP